MRARVRRSPALLDGALGLGVLAGSVGEVLAAGERIGRPGISIAAVIVIAAATAVRRRHPLSATGALLAALLLASALHRAGEGTLVEETLFPFAGVLLIVFTVGRAVPGAAGAVALVAVEAGMTASNLLTSTHDSGSYLFPGTMIAAAWIFGRFVHQRTVLAAELHEATLAAREEQEREAAAAVADERRRIAREMHDVVAHSVSVMVVQAGGARRILDADPTRAGAAARLIAEVGRDALAEMGRLLGVLEAEEGRTLCARPGLDGLETLVERARAAGLPVTLTVAGRRPALPAGAELAAFRVVQEGLTNVLKYAPGAPTSVDVRYGEEEIELVVADRGAQAASGDLGGGGHGLVGMAERLRAYGGELEAGPRPGGGFTVRARLPVRQEEMVAA